MDLLASVVSNLSDFFNYKESQNSYWWHVTVLICQYSSMDIYACIV